MEDIKIIGADKDKTRRTPEGLYDVYLKLSEAPAPDWLRIFDNIWYRPSAYDMLRQVRFSGKHLIITCGLDEIARTHLPQLKKVLKRTNTEYREYLVREREKAARQRKEAEEERGQVEETLDHLGFDE